MIRKVRTGSISYLEVLRGSGGWYWGTDYTSGDLYEAEELYEDRHRISRNRLIFADSSGRVVEPVKAEEGQYFGRPAFFEGRFIILLADFPQGVIRLMSYDDADGEVRGIVTIPRTEIENCYNLMPEAEPLMLTRQADNSFEVVWPERVKFPIGPTESFCFREGERFYFSKWYEDPDYREEVVVRGPDGSVLETFPGAINFMANGEKWILI